MVGKEEGNPRTPPPLSHPPIVVPKCGYVYKSCTPAVRFASGGTVAAAAYCCQQADEASSDDVEASQFLDELLNSTCHAALPSCSSAACSAQAPLTQGQFQAAPQQQRWQHILLHATQLVQDSIGKGPTVFKIGITADPAHRWGNVRYGYQHDKDQYQQRSVSINVGSQQL